MHRTASRTTVRFAAAAAGTSRLAACAAVGVCLLAAGPGFASDYIGSSGFPAASSSQQASFHGGDLRVPTVRPTMAGVDLGGSARHDAAHRNAVIASPLLADGSMSPDGVDAHRSDRSDRTRGATIFDGIASSTVAEPVSIAVLGFAAAALLALRRRKNAAVSQPD